MEYLAAGEGRDVRSLDSPEVLDEWMKELGAARKLLAVSKIEVATVDGRESMTQFGERAAVVSSRTRVPQAIAAQARGGVVASYSFEEIGTIVRATPHVREDGRMVHDMYLVEVKKPEESKGAWDYYRVLGTIAANDAVQPLSQSKCPLIKK